MAGYTGVHCETGRSVGAHVLVCLGTQEYIVRQVGPLVHVHLYSSVKILLNTFSINKNI